jgi:leucyl-tRNA synthetase
MKYRDVVKYAVYEFSSNKDEYLLSCQHTKPRRDLIELYLYWQLLIIYPICPHFCEIVYLDHFLQLVADKTKYPKFIGYGKFPEVKEKINYGIIKSHECIKTFLSSMRESYATIQKLNKKKNIDAKFTKATIIYRKHYQPYQIEVLKLLKQCKFDEENETKDDWRSKLTIPDK